MIALKNNDFVAMPRLRLRVYEPEAESPEADAKPRLRATRKTRNVAQWESVLFTIAVVGIIAALVINIACSTVTTLRAATITTTTLPVISITVAPGDTLWKLAERYGSSHEYILDRVQTISQLNHVRSGRPLQPGQRILVPAGDSLLLSD